MPGASPDETLVHSFGLPGVRRISRCALEAVPQPWAFANDNAAAIDAHWARSLAANAALFNGVIHLVHDFDLQRDCAGDCFRARFLRTDFKSYLYWRFLGFPEAGVRDGFGSALLRSSDGHIVLGRQRAGNVNGGLSYLPGGFIDARDVTAQGDIDIDASIAREVAEETGLEPRDMELQPGYFLTFAGPLISIAREHRVRLSSAQIRERILAHIADDPQSELTDAVIVRSSADLDGFAMPGYAQVLLPWLIENGVAGARP